MLTRRGPWLAEGVSLEAALAEAKAEKKKGKKSSTSTAATPPATSISTSTAASKSSQHTSPSQTQSPHTAVQKRTTIRTTTLTTHSSSSKKSTTSKEAYILARAGIPFIEAREYQPLLEKIQKAQRLALQSTYKETLEETKKQLTKAGIPEEEAEKIAKEAAAEAVHMAGTAIHEAQRVGLLAAAAAAGGKKAREMLEERTREFTEKYRENVEKAYQQAMRKLREEYINAKAKALADINRVEKQYKMLKAQGVTRVKVAVDTNGDGKPDKEVEMSLDEWYQQAIQRLRNYLTNLDKWYEEQKRRLNEWKERMLKELPRATVEAYTTWAFQTIQSIREYLKSVYVPQVVKAYKEYYELKRKLEELKKRLEPLYEEYAQQLAAIAEARGMGAHGLRAESEKLLQRFQEKAWEIARQLGIPEDKAREMIESYVDALRKTVTIGMRYGEAAKELQRLYEEYANMIKSLFGAVTEGKLNAVERIDMIVAEFERKVKNVAKKYGLKEEDVKDYIEKLREYANTVRKKGLVWATAKERAEQVLKTWLQEAKKNLSHYAMNVTVYTQRLREKLLRELQERGLSREEAEKLANYYAEKYRAEVERMAAQRWQQLIPADFICQRMGKGLYCKVYKNGQLVHTFTVQEYYETSNPEEWWQKNKMFVGMALSIGYKPEHMWIAKNEKEFKQTEMAYLREKNPKEYMKRLGEEVFYGKGGVLEKLTKGAEMVSEFYRIPAEKLMEKSLKEENPVLKTLGFTAAELAAVGTGIISTAVSAWNIPGWVKGSYEFAKSAATGELVETVKKKPTVAGEVVGSLLAGYALHKLGTRVGEKLLTKAQELEVKPPSPTIKAATLALKAAARAPQAVEAGLGAAAAAGLAAGLAEKPENIPYVAAPLLAGIIVKPEKIPGVEGEGWRLRIRGTGRTLAYYLKSTEGEKALGIGSPGKTELYLKIKAVAPETTVQGLYASPAEVRDIYIGLKKYGLPGEAEQMKLTAELAREAYKLGKKIPFEEVKLSFPRAGKYAEIVGEAVKEFLQKHAHEVEAAYGSAMYKSHLGEFWREVHDIDIQLKVTSPEEAARFARELAEYINRKVGKPIVKAEGTSVVFVETGKKLADIHYRGEPPEEAGSVFVSEKILGIRPKTRTVEGIPGYGAEYGALSKGESIVRLRRITPEELKVYEKYVEQGILPKRFVEWLKEAMEGREKGYYTAPQPWRVTKDAADFLYLVYKIAERTGRRDLIPDILRLQEYFKRKGMLPEDFDVRRYMPAEISKNAKALLEAFKETSGGVEAAIKELARVVSPAVPGTASAGTTVSPGAPSPTTSTPTTMAALSPIGPISPTVTISPVTASPEVGAAPETVSPPGLGAPSPTTPSLTVEGIPGYGAEYGALSKGESISIVTPTGTTSPPSTPAIKASTIGLVEKPSTTSPRPSGKVGEVSLPSAQQPSPAEASSPTPSKPSVLTIKPSTPLTGKPSTPPSGITPQPAPGKPSLPKTSGGTTAPESTSPPSPGPGGKPSPVSPPPGGSPPSPSPPSPPSGQTPSPPSGSPPSPKTTTPKPTPPKSTPPQPKPTTPPPPSTTPPSEKPSIGSPPSPPILGPALPPTIVLIATPAGLGVASPEMVDLLGRLIEEAYTFA